MSTLLKNNIVKELNNIQWSNDNNQENSDKSFEAIIKGIYNYLTNNYTFTGTYTGSHLTTPTPTPINGTTTHQLHYGSESSYLNIFKTTVRSGVATGGILRIFQGIQLFLTGTVQASITSTAPPLATYLPPLNTPLVPVVFPAITSYGTPCEFEILGKKPNNKEDAFTIIAKYIQLGLNQNIVAPMAFSGTLVSSVTAVATGVLIFN
jgi:hypothetical protein